MRNKVNHLVNCTEKVSAWNQIESSSCGSFMYLDHEKQKITSLPSGELYLNAFVVLFRCAGDVEIHNSEFLYSEVGGILRNVPRKTKQPNKKIPTALVHT